MSNPAALSILLTLVLGFLAGSCSLKTLQRDATQEFKILDFVQDGNNGLRLSWSATRDARIYRVWIARNSDCSQPVAQIATTDTTHLFARAAPGTYYACVQAVPSYEYASGDSCTEGITDVDGAGFDAVNQGMPLTIQAPRKGRWTKLEGANSQPRLVDTVGGIFIRSGSRLLIFNEQGQRLKELQDLRLTGSSKVRYAYTGGQIFAMNTGLDATQFYQWDESAQTWTRIHDFPGQLLVAFHLVSNTDLSFVLRSSANQMVQWQSLDPSNPAVLKSSPPLSSGADNWGYGYFEFASVYAEGAFVIADERGLHRLTPENLVTIAVQGGLNPTGIHVFPGVETEYALHFGDRIELQAAPTNTLICSFPSIGKSDWFVWNSKTNRWRKFPIHPYEGYFQLTSKGPVALPYLLGGRALQVMIDGNLETYADLPAKVETILSGPQLPQDRLLLSGGEELWMFEPDQL